MWLDSQSQRYDYSYIPNCTGETMNSRRDLWLQTVVIKRTVQDGGVAVCFDDVLRFAVNTYGKLLLRR